MMTAIILEDEIPAGKRLEKLLTNKGFVVLSIIVSVKNATKWFRENDKPDFVFIDIKLRDGHSFELFDKVDITSKIVFTTAYEEFALKAFDYNAIDYLLKPIDEKKLDKTILKLKSFEARDTAYYKNVFQKNTQGKFKSSYLIAVGNSLKKVETNTIAYFFSENNATYFINDQDRIFLFPKSLEKLEQELNPDIFFKISRKHLVNKKFVIEVHKNKALSISVKNKEENLKISRQRTKMFLEWYEK